MNDLFPSRNRMRHLNRGIFGDAFDNFFTDESDFSVDIQELDDAYIVEADLPGLDKGNIDLDYQDNILSIRAHQEQSKEETREEGKYIRKERSARSYQRQFFIENVKEDEISAKFDKGVLNIHLPKDEEDKKESRKIEIE